MGRGTLWLYFVRSMKSLNLKKQEDEGGGESQSACTKYMHVYSYADGVVFSTC